MLNKRVLLLTLTIFTAINILTACTSAREQVPTGSPTLNSSLSPIATIEMALSPTPAITLAPESTPIPTASIPSPTPQPNVTPEGEYSIYVNDVFGYQLRLPSTATITERGVESIPSNEVPAGMTVDEYENRLRAKYPGKLCVGVRYKLGSILISAPPNLYSRYAPCNTTGIGDYEVITRTETITVEGQSYTADGWEVKGPDQTLAHHYEFFRVTLADGTEIEYGSWPEETATYADYLKMKGDLLQIVASFARFK